MLPLPEANLGPGPPVFVTSWFTESSLVHLTVVPLATVSALGLNWMFFIDTAAALPAFLAGAAGAGFWALVLLLLLLSFLLPHPAATSPQATIEKSVAKNLVMGPPGGFRRTLVA